MDVYLLRNWTHHEPKRPKGTPGILQTGHKAPQGMAAVMLHLGNIPVTEDVDVAWLKAQIESLGFIHHLDKAGLEEALAEGKP